MWCLLVYSGSSMGFIVSLRCRFFPTGLFSSSLPRSAFAKFPPLAREARLYLIRFLIRATGTLTSGGCLRSSLSFTSMKRSLKSSVRTRSCSLMASSVFLSSAGSPFQFDSLESPAYASSSDGSAVPQALWSARYSLS